MAYVRIGLIVLAVTAAIGGTATASPIMRIDESYPRNALSLTSKQLEILDSLSDHGWHLGWFTGGNDPGLEHEWKADSPLGDVLFPNGSESALAAPTEQITTAPEPASLVLIASGLVAAAATTRRRRKPSDR